MRSIISFLFGPLIELLHIYTPRSFATLLGVTYAAFDSLAAVNQKKEAAAEVATETANEEVPPGGSDAA